MNEDGQEIMDRLKLVRDALEAAKIFGWDMRRPRRLPGGKCEVDSLQESVNEQLHCALGCIEDAEAIVERFCGEDEQ